MAGTRLEARECGGCGGSLPAGSIFCPMCGTPTGTTPSRDMRKHVVVLFADLADSTSLGELFDPEPLRTILSRYFESCSACVLEHGGLVEKFIGDAIMAVFGVPSAHEDDALRAFRAATGMLAAVARLNVELRATHEVTLGLRIGICSGEVAVTLFGNGDFRVIGDAVNTASRLQSAAPVGGVLACEQAAWMAQRQASFEPTGQIRLKGKAAPVTAWRLCALDDSPGDGTDSPEDGAFIDRRPHLDALLRSYQACVDHSECAVVTVLGMPGIGKSRLIREFIKKIPGEQGLVIAGHCRAYGRGASFQPIAEMVHSVPGGDDAARQALSALPDGERAWRCLAAVSGPDTGNGESRATTEEIGWAFRLLLRAMARRQPLIVIWDDLHWAEPTLIDLIGDAATWLTGAATLMICVARPEFLEREMPWRGPTMELGPLSDAETTELVAALSPGDATDAAIRQHVVTTAEGNPLFAELMLDMAGREVTGQGDDSRLPPGIIALISARLDLLPAGERGILERCATIGRYSTWEQLGVLMDGAESEAAEQMRRLVQARFLRREAAGASYCFTHALIADTAYAMTPKSLREQWHRRLADWLDDRLRSQGPHGEEAQVGHSHAEGGDMLAHHLERASLLCRELRPRAADTVDLTRRAARAVIGQGATALGRRDLSAAAGLLERGRDLLPPGDPEHGPLALRISDCWLGRAQPGRALAAIDAGAELLGAAPALLACLEVQRHLVRLRGGQATAEATGAAADLIAASLGTDPGYALAWCRLHYLEAFLHVAAERIAAAERTLAAGLHDARVVADEYEEERVLAGICELALWGPTTTSAGLARCQEMMTSFVTNRPLLVPTLLTQAGLLALTGQLATAEEVLRQALGYIEDMHLTASAAIATQVSGLVRFLAGDYPQAEADFRRGAAELIASGRVQGAATLLAYAARAAFEQGKPAAAEELLESIGHEGGDVRTRLITGALRARIASAHSEHELAISLAEAASGLARRTDDLWLQGDIFGDYGHVLAAAGRTAEARAVASGALERYSAKEAHLLAGRVSRWLADLAATPSPEGTR